MTQDSTKAQAVTRTSRRAMLSAGCAVWLTSLAAIGDADAAASGTSEQEQAAIKLVSDFIAAFSKRDLDEIASFMADDCRFKGTPTAPERLGKKAFLDDIGQFLNGPFGHSMTFAKGPTKVTAFGGEAGTAVMSKRVDYMMTNGKRVRQDLAAFYWVVNNKIQVWYDFGLSPFPGPPPAQTPPASR